MKGIFPRRQSRDQTILIMSTTGAAKSLQNGDVKTGEGDARITSTIEEGMDPITSQSSSVANSGREEWTTLRFTYGGKELSLSVEKSDRYVLFPFISRTS
jgi:hypothetical protein